MHRSLSFGVPDLLLAWPPWYVVLTAYVAYVGIGELRWQAKVAALLRQAESAAQTPNERARLRGYLVGGWVRAGSWLVGALLLLAGWNWGRGLVALGLAVSARRSFREFATGFAEGRKAAELAAAHEYVRGRVTPQGVDYVAAACLTLLTRVLPLTAAMYAIAALPR